MEAVGSYIQTLRDKQRVSRARMAEDIETTENTLWRIESGRQEPGIPLLGRILQYVKGSIEDVVRLASSPGATVEEGRAAAERILAACSSKPELPFTPDELAAVARLSPARRQILRDLIDQLGDDA